MDHEASDGGARPDIARALRQAPISIIELGRDLHVVEWNDGAERIFAHRRENAVGRRLTDLIVPNDEGDAWRSWLLAGDSGTRAWSHTRTGGGAMACLWSRQPMLDDAGEMTGLLCFAQDATEVAGRPKPTERLFQAILVNMAISVWMTDRSGVFTYNDGKGGTDAGIRPGQLVGLNILELYAAHPDIGLVRRALMEGEPTHKIVEAAGKFFENWYIPTYDERGEATGMVGVTYDVTEMKRVEQELRAKLDLIERQEQIIHQLSTPIIQVWDGVLTLPMIGVVDSVRTAEVMENLLQAVVTTRARYAILDLTGVEAVDTKTAAYLIELVRAIRLLGAEGIIAGIRPTVAQTVVTLGLDLQGVVTLANLRAALNYCIVRMRAQRNMPSRSPADGT